MKILALDPGEKAVGYAVVEKISEMLHTLNVVSTDKFKITGEEKRCQKELNKLLTIFQPDYVAYEKSGAFLEGVYKKILEEACQNALIPVMGCQVNDVREYVFGDPHMSKAESNQIVRDNILIFNQQVSNDELDAIAIGFYALRIKLR